MDDQRTEAEAPSFKRAAKGNCVVGTLERGNPAKNHVILRMTVGVEGQNEMGGSQRNGGRNGEVKAGLK